MKKIFSFLFIISLFLVVNVKADAGPPALPTLKARIKNDNVKCYEDYDRTKVLLTLNKNQKIEVNNYGGGFEYYDEEKEQSCFIDVKDLAIGEEEYVLRREDRLENEITIMPVIGDGVQMYTGPSEYYSKAEVIVPKGTILKTKYLVGAYWYYVTYNDVTGYISSENNQMVSRYDGDNKYVYYTTCELNITDLGDNENSKVLGKVPANVELTDIWRSDYTRDAYITYNGVTGFVDYYPLAWKDNGKIKTLKSVNVYNDLSEKKQKIGVNVANKEYDVLYVVSTDGQGYYVPSLKGWLYFDFSNEYETGKRDESNNFIYTDSNGDVYDSRDRIEKTVFDTMEITNANVTFSKDKYVYNVRLDDNVDSLSIAVHPETIKVDILNNSNLENGSRVTVRVIDDEGTYTYTFNIIKREIEPAKKETKDSNNTVLWICIGGGILVAITALVTIILVNKTKKNKNIEVVENKEVEETNKDIEENTNETKL